MKLLEIFSKNLNGYRESSFTNVVAWIYLAQMDTLERAILFEEKMQSHRSFSTSSLRRWIGCYVITIL